MYTLFRNIKYIIDFLSREVKLIIKVKVTPNAKEDKVIGYEGEILKIKVTSPPDKGKANQAVIDLLAKHFNIKKRCVIIKSGESSRLKSVIIDKDHSS